MYQVTNVYTLRAGTKQPFFFKENEMLQMWKSRPHGQRLLEQQNQCIRECVEFDIIDQHPITSEGPYAADWVEPTCSSESVQRRTRIWDRPVLREIPMFQRFGKLSSKE